MASRDYAWRAEQLLLGNSCQICHRRANSKCERTNTSICSRFKMLDCNILIQEYLAEEMKKEIDKYVIDLVNRHAQYQLIDMPELNIIFDEVIDGQ